MRNLAIICAVAAVLFGVNYVAAETWVTIDVPGAANTYLSGVDGENIVGRYYNPASGSRYFLYGQGVLTDLTVDGVSFSKISGNNIVGSTSAPAGESQGVIYDLTTATYDIVSYPGSDTTSISGMSGDAVVGTYLSASDKSADPYSIWYYHGCFYNGSVWAPVNMPGAIYTWPRDIDGDKVVGQYYDADYRGHGFLATIVAGVMTDFVTLDVSGSEMTNLVGISGDNIIGYYRNGYETQPFVYNNGVVTNINYQVGESPDPNSVNVGSPSASLILGGIDGDSIVGSYQLSSGGVHGFIRTAPEPATLALLGLGGLAMLRTRRRK